MLLGRLVPDFYPISCITQELHNLCSQPPLKSGELAESVYFPYRELGESEHGFHLLSHLISFLIPFSEFSNFHPDSGSYQN